MTEKIEVREQTIAEKFDKAVAAWTRKNSFSDELIEECIADNQQHFRQKCKEMAERYGRSVEEMMESSMESTFKID